MMMDQLHEKVGLKLKLKKLGIDVQKSFLNV